MAIGWAHSDGTSGVYDNPSEAVMEQPQVAQRGHTSDIPELGPAETERIWTDSGKPDHPSNKYPYEDTTKDEINTRLKDVGEGIFRRGLPHVEEYLKNLPGDYDAYHLNKDFFEEGLSDEQKKANPQLLYIKRKPLTAEAPTMREQLASFQQRLESTPPAEASELQKFFGSLNIMPRPGKPQEEWTVKEHLGYMLNTAMAGMGGGFRAPVKTPMTRLFRSETSTLPGEKPAPMSEWLQDDPAVQGMLKATGRWFTNSKETAQWYQDKMGGKGISFVDVPTSEVQQHLASRNPEAARFTAAGREKEEYFLPSDIAAKRKPLSSIVSEKTVNTPSQEQLATYETLSSQGKTTKQIVKGTKLDPEQVREALGRDNLAIAAFNSENSLTNAYFKSLEKLDPALGEALKKQVSVKDLKRYTRGLPEEQLKTIFEQLPESVKQVFESGEQRRMNIDAGKKSKVIPKPLK